MSQKTRMIVPVSSRALLQRINRKLAKECEQVLKCRENSNGHRDLGDYYRVDRQRNSIVDTHVNLEVLAKELGLLGIAEGLED